MGDYLSFKKLITPILIRLIFWLGVIGSIGGGILMIVGMPTIGIEKMMVPGIGAIVLGPLAVRLVCEGAILGFEANNTLTDIKNILENKPA